MQPPSNRLSAAAGLPRSSRFTSVEGAGLRLTSPFATFLVTRDGGVDIVTSGCVG